MTGEKDYYGRLRDESDQQDSRLKSSVKVRSCIVNRPIILEEQIKISLYSWCLEYSGTCFRHIIIMSSIIINIVYTRFK